MTCKGSVGQTTTLTLSGDTVIGRIRNLQMPEWFTEAVDFSSLDLTNWMCFIPGGLIDPGQFVAEVFFDSEIARPTVRLVQTATITFPIQTAGNAAAATLIGSGFITGLTLPNAAIAEPMMETITFKYDGSGTPPAFTLEAAT